MIVSLLQQIKDRRIGLGLKQKDMMMRIGVSRQQYQRLESKGNPQLDTLELIAKGLNCELMLIPKEKQSAVLDILEGKFSESGIALRVDAQVSHLSDDPWQNLLEEDLE